MITVITLKLKNEGFAYISYNPSLKSEIKNEEEAREGAVLALLELTRISFLGLPWKQTDIFEGTIKDVIARYNTRGHSPITIEDIGYLKTNNNLVTECSYTDKNFSVLHKIMKDNETLEIVNIKKETKIGDIVKSEEGFAKIKDIYHEDGFQLDVTFYFKDKKGNIYIEYGSEFENSMVTNFYNLEPATYKGKINKKPYETLESMERVLTKSLIKNSKKGDLVDGIQEDILQFATKVLEKEICEVGYIQLSIIDSVESKGNIYSKVINYSEMRKIEKFNATQYQIYTDKEIEETLK